MPLETMTAAGILTGQYNTKLPAKPTDPNGVYLLFLSHTLDDNFQKGLTTETNVDITTPAGTLNIPVSAVATMPEVIGQHCADYWSKTIELTGEPVGSNHDITLVENDAQKIVAPIAAGLRSLGGSASPLNPSYFDFVNVIDTEVKTIIWTVEETNQIDDTVDVYEVLVT